MTILYHEYFRNIVLQTVLQAFLLFTVCPHNSIPMCYTVFMKKIKKLIILSIICSIFIPSLLAAETQIAKDFKVALKNYAGMSELQKRGFKLKELDSVQSVKDIHNILLPYMIQDGVPLDNAINIQDNKAYGPAYSFKQHYNVHFTDDYGTKQELLKKGYKENEILPYYSKGEGIYRGW